MITQISTSVQQTMAVVTLKPRAVILSAASRAPAQTATKEMELPAQVMYFVLKVALASL